MKKKHLFIIIIIIIIIVGSVTSILFLKKNNPQKIHLTIATPKAKFGLLTDQWNIISDTIKKDDFLGSILYRYGVNGRQIDMLAKLPKDSINHTLIHVGQLYHVFYDTSINNVPQMKYLVYENDLIKYTRYDFSSPDTIIIYNHDKQIDTIEKTAYGVIHSSLWQALVEKGYSWSIAIALSQAFAWSVDFYALQKEDWFKIIYDDLIVDGKSIGLPEIKAGLFFHGGRELWLIPFKANDTTQLSFYDTVGNSMRKAFLKAPLKYTRISSRYSNSRMHPIFHKPTEHRAVDFGAPCGTPIYAAADGTITFRGWDVGGGNMMIIRHNSIYTTVYMHMSQFGKFQVGDHVFQSETIGYVGSTGWSTGCHLHYEVHENGVKIDPLTFDPPSAEPLDSAYLPRFNEEKLIWIEKLKNIKEE